MYYFCFLLKYILSFSTNAYSSVYNLINIKTSFVNKKYLPEMGDWDDDHQVESHSEWRQSEQQDVIDHNFTLRDHWLQAGGIEQLWKTELGFCMCFHQWNRDTMQIQGSAVGAYEPFFCVRGHASFLSTSDGQCCSSSLVLPWVCPWGR